MMPGRQFEYPFYLQGIYRAMLWLGLIAPLFVIWFPVKWVFSYYLLLAFLGLGLRPLLEKTRLMEGVAKVMEAPFERRREKMLARRAAQIDQKERQKSLRYRHRRGNELPPNW